MGKALIGELSCTVTGLFPFEVLSWLVLKKTKTHRFHNKFFSATDLYNSPETPDVTFCFAVPEFYKSTHWPSQ